MVLTVPVPPLMVCDAAAHSTDYARAAARDSLLAAGHHRADRARTTDVDNLRAAIHSTDRAFIKDVDILRAAIHGTDYTWSRR